LLVIPAFAGMTKDFSGWRETKNPRIGVGFVNDWLASGCWRANRCARGWLALSWLAARAQCSGARFSMTK
jgi:hypothetical protein